MSVCGTVTISFPVLGLRQRPTASPDTSVRAGQSAPRPHLGKARRKGGCQISPLGHLEAGHAYCVEYDGRYRPDAGDYNVRVVLVRTASVRLVRPVVVGVLTGFVLLGSSATAFGATTRLVNGGGPPIVKGACAHRPSAGVLETSVIRSGTRSPARHRKARHATIGSQRPIRGGSSSASVSGSASDTASPTGTTSTSTSTSGSASPSSGTSSTKTSRSPSSSATTTPRKSASASATADPSASRSTSSD